MASSLYQYYAPRVFHLEMWKYWSVIDRSGSLEIPPVNSDQILSHLSPDLITINDKIKKNWRVFTVISNTRSFRMLIWLLSEQRISYLLGKNTLVIHPISSNNPCLRMMPYWCCFFRSVSSSRHCTWVFFLRNMNLRSKVFQKITFWKH